jgi:hypothetical protein
MSTRKFKFINDVPQNDLQMLLKLYPNAKWDFNALSANSNINLDFILLNMGPEMPWNFKSLCNNKSITIDNIISTLHIINWDFKLLTFEFPINEILKNMFLPWDEQILMERLMNMYLQVNEFKNLRPIHSYEYLIYIITLWKNNCVYNDIEVLTRHSPYITEEFVLENKLIDMPGIIENKNISTTFVINNDEHVRYNGVEWFMYGLSVNPNLKLYDIIKYKHLSWFYHVISSVANIPIQDMINCSPPKNNLSDLSANPNLSWQDVYINEECP